MSGLRVTAANFRADARGALKGYVDLTFHGGEAFELTIAGCLWLESNGKEWVNFPGIPQIRDERIVRDDRGKQLFTVAIKLGGSREYRDKLQAAMVRAIYRHLGGEQRAAGAPDVSPFA
jgi:hypothetical protein